MNRSSDGGRPAPVRWRAGLLSGALLVGSIWSVQRIDLVYGGPDVAGGVYSAVAIVVAGLASLAGKLLTRADRLLLYASLAVGLPIAGSGLIHRLLPALVTGSYGGFASPAGRYYPFVSRIPKWMAPGGPGSHLATGAFEGGGAVPWSGWLPALLFWWLFLLTLFFTSACLVLCLRKRLVETERLAFPLLTLPRDLIESRPDSLPIIRNRRFWAGACVSALLFAVNGLHHYAPAVGEIQTTLNLGEFLLDDPWWSMAPFTSPFQFVLSPLMTGLAYLMPVEVSFGTWVFFLVSRLQLLVGHLAGLSEMHGTFPSLGSQWLDWPNTVPFFMCQARGGLLVMAVYALWAARGSLRESVSDTPPAFLGMCLGGVMLWAMMWAMGLGPFLSLVSLIAFFLFAVAFLRLRADGGLPVVGSPIIPGYLILLVVGTGPERFDSSTYVGVAFLAVMAYTLVGAWPTIQLELFKLHEEAGCGPRQAARTLGIAAVVGLLAGTYFFLSAVYDAGLFVLDQQGGARSVARLGRYYHYLYADAGILRSDIDWTRIGFHAMGAGIAVVLLMLRGRFLRWPLHPIGYIYGTGMGWSIWGGAFSGWLAKWLVTRYGGARTYRNVRPFFLGLVFGQLAMAVFWGAVGVIHGEMGVGYAM